MAAEEGGQIPTTQDTHFRKKVSETCRWCSLYQHADSDKCPNLLDGPFPSFLGRHLPDHINQLDHKRYFSSIIELLVSREPFLNLAFFKSERCYHVFRFHVLWAACVSADQCFRQASFLSTSLSPQLTAAHAFPTQIPDPSTMLSWKLCHMHDRQGFYCRHLSSTYACNS